MEAQQNLFIDQAEAVDRLATKVVFLKNENRRLDTDNIRLRQEREQLRSEVAQLRKKLEECNNGRDTLRHRNVVLSKQFESLRQIHPKETASTQTTLSIILS